MPGLRCCVEGCNNSLIGARKSHKNIYFHRFPKDKQLCQLWIQKCKKLAEWNPKNFRVCSEHFTADDYQRVLQADFLKARAHKKLKGNAVPSLNFVRSLSPVPSRNETTNCPVLMEHRLLCFLELPKQPAVPSLTLVKSLSPVPSRSESTNSSILQENSLLVQYIFKNQANCKPDLSKNVPLVTSLPSPTLFTSETQKVIPSFNSDGRTLPEEEIKEEFDEPVDHLLDVKNEPSSDSEIVIEYPDFKKELDETEEKYSIDSTNYDDVKLPDPETTAKVCSDTLNSNGFDEYGKYVATRLKQLSLEKALEAQTRINTVLNECEKIYENQY